MKCTLSLILLVSFLPAFSQTYLPIPLDGGQWIEETVTFNDEGVPNYGGSRLCTNGNEIALNGQTYTEVENCYDGSVVAAIRTEAGVTYAIDVQSSSQGEYLLYDFNLELGDTVDEVFWWGGLGEVAMIGSVTIGGQERKTIYFTDYSGYWIEGIGGSAGLLNGAVDLFLSGTNELVCMSEDVNTLFPDELNGACDLTFSVSEKTSLKTTELTAYPNPSSALFSIDIGDEYNSVIPSQVQILDITGKEVTPEITINRNRLEIQMTNYPAGIYSLKLTLENGVYMSRLIKE